MNDGDKALVIQDKTLIEVAEREMEGIVPLYYEMAKAEDTLITPDKVYESLTSAYKANIGIISNDITKIWNSPNPDINAVKWLTMKNNFVIDYAKTLFLPKTPDYAEKVIKSFTKNKVPHFFMYAKDKEERLVENINESTVNKLDYIIEDKQIRFRSIAGMVNHKNFMKNKKVKITEKVIEKFLELHKAKRIWLSQNGTNEEYHFDDMLRKELKKLSRSESQIVDSLVEYLYSKNSTLKGGLWNAYGDILYNNLLKNLGNTMACELCPERFDKIGENARYCKSCAEEVKKENERIRSKKYRENKKRHAF